MSEKDESFSEQMSREMAEKTPGEAVMDDLGGSGEPTAGQEEALEGKVQEKRDADEGS